MKKRIIIALLIIVVLAGVGTSLYFFVFKNKGMTTLQASNLINRMAISAEAIEDFEDSPTFKNFPGSSETNKVINTEKLPSLAMINFSDWDNLTTDESEEGVKNLISGLVNFMKKEKLSQKKVYVYIIEDTKYRLNYAIIGSEIIFIVENVEEDITNISYVSIFYNSKYEEFEMSIVSRLPEKGLNFIRVKISRDGIKSIEKYMLTIITEDIEEAINEKEGNTLERIMDFSNDRMRTSTFAGPSEENEILSNYIYQVYKNFTKKLGDRLKLIKEETDCIFLENSIYSGFFK